MKKNPPISTSVVVVGGGPAGLATSWHLGERQLPHVVLERGRTAERWRSERWNSLRLLTPNRHARLPGWPYTGALPEGFMTMPEVVEWLDSYADSFGAPVLTNTAVLEARAQDNGFLVETARATFRSDALVVATGTEPSMPNWRHSLPPSIAQLHSSRYTCPEALCHGGVLVVGASASGIQLADELVRAGRRVVVSVGSHTRLPRTYRGRDIHWWLDLSGKLDVTIDQITDLDRARRAPSLQLVGSPEGRSLDLNALADAGAELVGRSTGARGSVIDFADDLASNCGSADRRQLRLLDEFDALATAAGFDHRLPTPYRPIPTRIPPVVRSVDLAEHGITTVLWATGFRQSYPWLRVPVTDDDGPIRHEGVWPTGPAST